MQRLITSTSPASIAVAGASGLPGTVGNAVWHGLNSGSYSGKLYAVNRHYGELAGYVVYGRVQDLPAVPELALICAPPAEVAALVEAFGKLGTRRAVVLTEGMAAEQWRAMQAAAAVYGVQIENGDGLKFPALQEPEPALAA